VKEGGAPAALADFACSSWNMTAGGGLQHGLVIVEDRKVERLLDSKALLTPGWSTSMAERREDDREPVDAVERSAAAAVRARRKLMCMTDTPWRKLW